MQINDTHLLFLRGKIKDIRVALFKSEINSELSLPNNVVETIHTDNEGNIFFFTSCNGNHAAQINLPFYAYLDYYKKGTDTRLKISGKAMIVNEERNAAAPEIEERGISSRSVVLVKMKIMQAEFSGEPMQENTWTKKIKSTFNHFFFPASEQHYSFNYLNTERQN